MNASRATVEPVRGAETTRYAEPSRISEPTYREQPRYAEQYRYGEPSRTSEYGYACVTEPYRTAEYSRGYEDGRVPDRSRVRIPGTMDPSQHRSLQYAPNGFDRTRVVDLTRRERREKTPPLICRFSGNRPQSVVRQPSTRSSALPSSQTSFNSEVDAEAPPRRQITPELEALTTFLNEFDWNRRTFGEEMIKGRSEYELQKIWSLTKHNVELNVTSTDTSLIAEDERSLASAASSISLLAADNPSMNLLPGINPSMNQDCDLDLSWNESINGAPEPRNPSMNHPATMRMSSNQSTNGSSGVNPSTNHPGTVKIRSSGVVPSMNDLTVENPSTSDRSALNPSMNLLPGFNPSMNLLPGFNPSMNRNSVVNPSMNSAMTGPSRVNASMHPAATENPSTPKPPAPNSSMHLLQPQNSDDSPLNLAENLPTTARSINEFSSDSTLTYSEYDEELRDDCPETVGPSGVPQRSNLHDLLDLFG